MSAAPVNYGYCPLLNISLVCDLLFQSASVRNAIVLSMRSFATQVGRTTPGACETKCRQDVNGFLAIPFTASCYNKLVAMTNPVPPANKVTPIWTGIKVRTTGLYDPRNKKAITMLGNQPNPSNPSQKTSYGTYLVGDAYIYRTTHSKTENCIYFDNGFYVESKCNFLHTAPLGLPIQSDRNVDRKNNRVKTGVGIDKDTHSVCMFQR